MSKTRIVVLHLKEIIYTAIFVALGILLIILLIFMFLPKDDSAEDTAKYKAGVYTSQMVLNNTALNLEIVVDENDIKSLRFVNLDEAITTMYPLVEPALTEIEAQLIAGKQLSEITLTQDRQYTQTAILQTIESTLYKALLEKPETTKEATP